jgi:hypothetical protein
MHRDRMFLVGLAILLTVASPASAGIVFTLGNSPQPNEESIVFADQSAATTIVGTSNLVGSNSLSLTGTTTSGSQFVASTGHVLPTSGLITSLTITPSSSLAALILNPVVLSTGGGGGAITYSILANDGTFTFDTTLGNGNNFLTITTVGGESIQSLTLTATTGFNQLQNVFAVYLPAAALPESGTWAMMLLGFAGIGVAMRRRRPAALPGLG